MSEMYFEDHPTDPDKVIIRKQVRTTTPEDIQKIQRTWVGLTDEEINELWAKTGNIVGFGGLMFETIRAVEAKLKEKNTWTQ